MSEIEILEGLFKQAEAFVNKHYTLGADQRDRNIKILATINQLIELKKLPPPDNAVEIADLNSRITRLLTNPKEQQQ